MTSSDLDLTAYRIRIGHDGPLAADLDTLCALHRAHVLRIPFENLDIQMGQPIRIDLQSLQEKLVANGRGGYCFEQNTLFHAVLRAIGFDVIPCEARVRPPGGQLLPRTHMVLVTRLRDRRWLCDVGFGADGPAEPVPLDGEEVTLLGDTLRVADEGTSRVLQVSRAGTWVDLYAFAPEQRFPVDFEVASWFTSTHPESRFVRTLTAQRITPEGRHVVRGLEYSIRTGEVTTTRLLSRAELLPVHRDVMGIPVPDGVRFSSLDPG